ncbi:MAG TPA: hypothetical protein RMF84_13450, partial [Polyangiaceae bacterium LLY-WYZ-14_1]|nr:hypothetical protein [Polyangiaceae bacterium LLY-WYZ-14_1]
PTATAPSRRSSAFLEALHAGDPDRLEEVLRDARERGVDPDVVERIRAVARLLQGQVDAAIAELGGDGTAAAPGPDADGLLPRPALTQALLMLSLDRPVDGVRAATEALARARRREDERGVKASLRTLEAAYRALGRDEQADSLLAASLRRRPVSSRRTAT